ncbi:MAG: ATP-dependent DNA helicase, partial [Actinomycetota bacterium]|nr:ATP-dependent DNA helicase [Actinomycetota bacterium]
SIPLGALGGVYLLHPVTPPFTTLDIGARITRVIQSIDSLLENVREARWLEDDSVAWVESTYGRPTMKVALISVDHILNENLWPLLTVVLTSATVPANLANRLGLDEESFSFEDVGSPFDFENQALLYCASHLPDPRNQNYREELHDEIERLIIAAGGRTLALFTSRRALDEATSYLRPRLPFTIFHQDDLPKPALISAFSREEESCLFGTKGLWHGIDIPGPSCSLVIIDRIPFPSPADPLLSARREKIGDSSFREIDLPIAATELSQGVGRLIRSTSDFGVVAVLDSRLAKTDSYRGQLLEALPPMTRTTDLESVTSYLERIETRL